MEPEPAWTPGLLRCLLTKPGPLPIKRTHCASTSSNRISQLEGTLPAFLYYIFFSLHRLLATKPS